MGNAFELVSPSPLFSAITNTPLTVGLLHRAAVGECPRGVMVKAMDYVAVESEFKLQSRYYVHFQTLEKGILPAIS